MIAIFEHKITQLKAKGKKIINFLRENHSLKFFFILSNFQIVKELSESQNESYVVQIRNKMIEELQKDNLFYKKELQRVNGLYVKYKNNIGKYKKKIQDLTSTNQVYFEKISELLQYNEKFAKHNRILHEKFQVVMSTTNLSITDDLDMTAFDEVIQQNKEFVSNMKHQILIAKNDASFSTFQKIEDTTLQLPPSE